MLKTFYLDVKDAEKYPEPLAATLRHGHLPNQRGPLRFAMSDPSNPHADAAIQHLIWALEEIEKSGEQMAAQHARMALNCLRDAFPATSNTVSRSTSRDQYAR